MIPVPAGSVTIETPDGPQEVEVGSFWIGKTEVVWDAYDVYVYGLDKNNEGLSEAELDAVARPSKPYVLPGEDFGHKGYPALAMTRRAAVEYARWLSAKTDQRYRLPTRAEWKHACQLGMGTVLEAGTEALEQHAWVASNADKQTHPIGSSDADALGLHDMLGNAAEYVEDPNPDDDKPPVAWGGSYRTEPSEVDCNTRIQKTPAWQASDPQLPKSRWWLSDAPFVSFRLVRVPDVASQSEDGE
jgi:formylglycine-generating enzyme required for sulfatase activity